MGRIGARNLASRIADRAQAGGRITRFPAARVVAIALLLAVGCGERRPVAPTLAESRNAEVPAEATAAPDPPRILNWGAVEDLDRPLAVMETVFWEPDDTESLRKLIRETELVRDKRVFEIGVGSGLVALCCLQAGASRVVATDINPNAITNAAYNARELGLEERLELRRVEPDAPGAFAVVAPDERFDVILSNPPWEDQQPHTVAEYALYDRSFALMKSLVAGLRDHLRPGGRVLLAYGCRSAITTLQQLSAEHGYETRILDDRDLAALPEVFLPGMLIEVLVKPDAERP